MQNNYRIKFNHQEPSSEDINRRMDFDALLSRHESGKAKVRQLGLRRWVYRSAAAAAVALVLISLWPVLRNDKNNLDAEAYFAEQPYVNPQNPNWQPTANIQKVDAHRGGVIEYPSGSRLVIPASAFMNDKGQLIGGEVEIHYRELHDYIDFFAGGIPMRYDSNGQRLYLESAGMIEIYASQDGREIKLDPNKPLNIELVSTLYAQDFFSLPSLLVYQLDTVARNWQYSQPDQAQWLESTENDAIALEQRKWEGRFKTLQNAYTAQVNALEATVPLPPKPAKPERAEGKQATLELDFLNGDIALAPGSDLSPAELERLHRDAIWEIAPESPAFDERAFQVTWEQVRLRKLEGRNYELTLIHAQNQQTLIVRPALLGEDYNRALAEYERLVLEYESALAARVTRLQSQRQTVDANYQRQLRELETEFGHFVEGLANEGNLRDRLLRRRIVHRFRVNATGIWNCARVVQPATQAVAARYIDDEGSEISDRTAFMVNRGQNTVYHYLAAPGASLDIQPEAEQLIWVVLTDGQLALAHRQPADKLNTDYTFTLQRVDKNISSISELRETLKFE